MPKASWMDIHERYVYRTTTGTMISPYKSNLSPDFEKRYSIRRKNAKFAVPYSGFYLTKEHVFVCPSDLSMDFLVGQYFPGYLPVMVPPTVAEACYPFQVNIDELRPQQVQFIEEAQMAIRNGHRRIFCNMQTGFGKTLAMIYMLQFHQKKTVMITYMDRLINQWSEVFEERTDLPKERILTVKGSEMLEKMRKNPFKYHSYDIFLISHETLTSYAKKYGYPGISDLFASLGIGVKIYDEAHHSIRSMVAIDAYTSVEYTYYLTADYNQSSNSKAYKYRNIFKNVPILPTSNKGVRYVTCMSIIYNSHPPLRAIKSTEKKIGFSILDYMRYEYTQEIFYQSIEVILDKLRDSEKFQKDARILILTSYVDGLHQIYHRVKEKYEDSLGPVMEYYGDMEEEAKEDTKQHGRIIVATYGTFSVGLDVPNIQCVISCDQISRIQANQAAGRVRPSNDPNHYALFVMLYDFGFDYCVSSRKRVIDYLRNGKALNFINYMMKE